MTISKNVCLIPAKAASTRLKKKNILKINGKELVGYTIEAAKTSDVFADNIFVSTESGEIRDIALKYHAKVHIRPEALAHDPYGIKDVMLDFLDSNSDYKDFDNIFVLLPTAPLIISEDIINSFSIYCKNDFKYLMSAKEDFLIMKYSQLN